MSEEAIARAVLGAVEELEAALDAGDVALARAGLARLRRLALDAFDGARLAAARAAGT